MEPTLVKYIKTKDKILINLIGIPVPVLGMVENMTVFEDDIEFEIVLNYLDDYHDFKFYIVRLNKRFIVLRESVNKSSTD